MPRESWASRDYMAVFETEDDVRALAPDMALLMALDRHAVIATAPGRTVDFVSRFFVCEDRGVRVSIGGRVAPYLEGTIEVPG